MAFNMEKFGIEEARQTAERALKVINFRSESERLNIWHSYMNLEHIFGTEASLIR
jgi:rRNA biogenesis protein RRP5